MSRYISKSVVSQESKIPDYWTIDEAERILGLRFRPELKKFLTNTPALSLSNPNFEFATLSKSVYISVVEQTLGQRGHYDNNYQRWYFDANWVVVDGGLGNGDYTIFDNLTGKVGVAYHDAPASFKDDNSFPNLAAFVKYAQKAVDDVKKSDEEWETKK